MSFSTPVDPIAPQAPDRGGITGADLGAAAIVAMAVGLGGVLLGLAWYLVAPPLPLRKVEQGLAYISPEPEELVAQDGWFAILGLVFGVLVAVVVWVVVRRRRGPVQLTAVLIGAALAGWVAWLIGSNIDASEFKAAQETAPIGTIIEKPIDLSASAISACLPTTDRCVTTRAGNLFVPAFGAVLAYSLLAGWSRFSTLRREEEEELFSSEMEPDPAGPGSPAQREFP